MPHISIDLPLDSGEQPSHVDIHGLSTHRTYGWRMLPSSRWALTSPFHPCQNAWRLFSVTLPWPRGQLPVRKYGALRCPDFPLAVTASDKPFCYYSTKVTKKLFLKQKLLLLFVRYYKKNTTQRLCLKINSSFLTIIVCLFHYRANWLASKTSVESIIIINTIRSEEHTKRAVRVVRADRTRPIVADGSLCEEHVVTITARRREKNMVTIGLARYDSSFYAYAVIVACPSLSAVIY